jgi:hypothetical protein
MRAGSVKTGEAISSVTGLQRSLRSLAMTLFFFIYFPDFVIILKITK